MWISTRQRSFAGGQEYYFGRTSLGEESTEAVVRVSGLALIGQVAIGLQGDNALVTRYRQRFGAWEAYLDAVFEAVELLDRQCYQFENRPVVLVASWDVWLTC